MMFQMMGQGSIATNYTIFGQEIIARMKEAPYFCTKDCEGENFTVVGIEEVKLSEKKRVLFIKLLNYSKNVKLSFNILGCHLCWSTA